MRNYNLNTSILLANRTALRRNQLLLQANRKRLEELKTLIWKPPSLKRVALYAGTYVLSTNVSVYSGYLIERHSLGRFLSYAKEKKWKWLLPEEPALVKIDESEILSALKDLDGKLAAAQEQFQTLRAAGEVSNGAAAPAGGVTGNAKNSR